MISSKEAFGMCFLYGALAGGSTLAVGHYLGLLFAASWAVACFIALGFLFVLDALTFHMDATRELRQIRDLLEGQARLQSVERREVRS